MTVRAYYQSNKDDLSGGIQSATSWLLRKRNELEDGYNITLNKYLGSVVRRLGYIKEGDSMPNATRTQGLHEAKFATGAIIFAAQNNTGATATVLNRYQKSAGTAWTATTLPNAIDPNTALNMTDSLGEMYIAGRSTSTGNRVQTVNMKNDYTVSTTRNLYGAPKAQYITEYQGALYAMNVDINGVVYSDRAYRSSNALGAITFFQGYQAPQNGTFIAKTDSVQYLKPGMVLDVYKAGTETKTYDSLTIISVDKNLKTITFTAQSTTTDNTLASTSTDQITVASSALLPTGQPLTLSGGTAPTGLTLGTTYYAINIDSTHIKLASSYSNAIASPAVPIDITAVGSGTSTVYQGMSDNDELWGHARKNELAYYWNLDYPTVDQADFLRIIPGIASDPSIAAYGKNNNRLMFFTKSATFKWDNANLVTIFEDIGCINQESIVNINDWIIWVDADGQIHARNDSTGQHEVISRGIRNKWLENVTQAQFITASAGRSKNVYKICVGTVNGQIWQFNYDFDSNNWVRDIITKTVANRLRSDMSGNMRAYFADTAGQLWLDEQGNSDDTATIPFYINLGKDNEGTNLGKNFQGMYIHGVNTAGANVSMSIDDSDPKDMGQLTGSTTAFKLNESFKGRRYNLEITQNSEGDPIAIEATAMFWAPDEDGFAT